MTTRCISMHCQNSPGGTHLFTVFNFFGKRFSFYEAVHRNWPIPAGLVAIIAKLSMKADDGLKLLGADNLPQSVSERV